MRYLIALIIVLLSASAFAQSEPVLPREQNVVTIVQQIIREALPMPEMKAEFLRTVESGTVKLKILRKCKVWLEQGDGTYQSSWEICAVVPAGLNTKIDTQKTVEEVTADIQDYKDQVQAMAEKQKDAFEQMESQ